MVILVKCSLKYIFFFDYDGHIDRATSEKVKELLNFFNDPSAGSPTETLLRLLVPLNDQVCPNSPL